MLRIHTLGDLEVDIDGHPVALPCSPRLRSLLAWLALHPGSHSRARVAATLWPDVPDANARANLRSALWSLRTELDDAVGQRLRTDRTRVELDGTDLVVDMLEFARLVSAGQDADAVELCRGDLLADHTDEWVLQARETFEDQLTAALAAAARTAERAGNATLAIDFTRRRANLRPFDESAGYDLTRLLDAAGDGSRARATSANLADRLRDELGVVANRARPHPSPPDNLVGRDDEFRGLTETWRRVQGGAGSVVALSGAGGIGKTRLAEAVLGVAAEDGAWTAIGAPGALGGAPYELWSELLAEAVTDAASEGVRLPPDAAWTNDLARLFPAVGLHIGAAPVPVPMPQSAPNHDKIRLFESVVELLGFLARRRPVALLLEDLHRADPSSLELIGYAGRRIGRLPILLVVTRRRQPPRPAVDGPLGRLRARGTLRSEIDLTPLRPSVIRTLARGYGALSPTELDRIVAVAGGSPLIAVEAARHIGNGGNDPVQELRAATTALLSRLSEPGRLFVELAAVAGRDLDRSDLAAFPLLADPDRAAAEATGTGLLRTREGRIGFRHDLLRLAVYDDLAGSTRMNLHDAWATALLPDDRQHDRRRAAELAGHLRRAGRHDLAADQLRDAAAAARAVAALPEAAHFLDEAVELRPDDATTLAELAEVQAWRGKLAESDHAFDRAVALTSDTRAVVRLWLRRGRWLRGGICHPRESRRSYRAALDLLDRDPAPEGATRAEALAGLAWAESVAGDPATTDELLREVAALTRGEPMTDLLIHDIGVARGHALLRAGRFTDSYGPLIAAAAAATRAGWPDMAYSCLVNAAGAAACAGQFDRALDFADRCLTLVVPNGLLQLVVHTQCGRAALLRRLGRFGDARAALDAAQTASDRLDMPEQEGLVRQERGLLALAAGDFPVAVDDLQRALDLDAPISRPTIRLYRAEALVLSGRLTDAVEELRRVVVEPVSDADFPDTLVARMTRVQGLLAREHGDTTLAATRLRHAAEIWERRSTGLGAGDRYAANIVDLGRPPLTTLVEPAREHASVLAELAELRP